MFQAFANVTKTLDKTNDIFKGLQELAKKDVLVGIPEEDSSRPGGKINNVELAYIHTHGVRSKKMREEMGNIMEMGNNGVAHDPMYDKFLNNMSKMNYSQAYAMYIQANGSPLWHSPPRPIIEPAIENSKDKIAEQMKKVAAVALEGGNANQELQNTGQMGENIVRAWFTDPRNRWPENAESTKKAKGSENPLIDTGNLRKSITYVIREES